jgi:hypothetical protein
MEEVEESSDAIVAEIDDEMAILEQQVRMCSVCV